MQQQHTVPTVSDLVLIGGGHAHVHVLKMLGMKKPHGLRITLIAKDILTPYSGMLPGYVAGHYTKEQIHLDLNQLCRFAGARLVHAAATRLDCVRREVHCLDGRPPIRFDACSIDIGSQPAQATLHPSIIPVKPIASFCDFFERLLLAEPHSTLAVVGGGAGGLELALALRHRLPDVHVVVVTRGPHILPNHNRKVRTIVQRILHERNIPVYTHCTVTQVETHENSGKRQLLYTAEQSQPLMAVDHILWCTHAGVAPWLAQSGLPTDPTDGSVWVDTTYQTHCPGIFAAGDCCRMQDCPRPKAGVFAVRAGPTLYQNLLRYLQGKHLLHHRLQKEFLGILATGDEYAVASKGWWFCLEGKWVWKWKDWIDRQWMSKYQDLPETIMAQMPSTFAQSLVARKGGDVREAFEADPMRCGGCGAKVGSTTVARVLRKVHQRQIRRAQELGLAEPEPMDHDDAAVVNMPQGSLIQTIDYFREMVSDPFVFGKIVAVHALSDVHAMGATPQSALTLAVAPFAADEAITESTLLHMISGISDVLQDEGVRMIGGHTCEGMELACGLSVQGFASDPSRLLRKRGGTVGDKIILTKPLGTGALLAADMRAQSRGEHVAQAIESMCRSNVVASRIAMKMGGIHSCTDVTGFGLVGHLLEMLMANEGDKSLSSIGAELDIKSMRFLEGGLDASSKQIFSSLQPQNARNRRAIANHSKAATTYPTEYPLLFDPQTAGGLMFFVAPPNAAAFVEKLQSEGVDGHCIGEVISFAEVVNEAEAAVNGGICTIGSGETATGLRIRIKL